MIESSHVTSTGETSSSTSAPQWSLAHTHSAVSRRPRPLPSAFSWLRMLRMSAELSALTSVAVFRPPDLSGLKYCEPKPHSSPSAERAAL